MGFDAKIESDEHRQFRRLAIVAVALSMFAICMAVVTVPLLYSYAHRLHTKVIDETDFCKMSSRDMWHEMFALQNRLEARRREKRGWLFGQWRDDGVGDAGGSGAYSAPAPMVFVLLFQRMLASNFFQPQNSLLLVR
ncbi:unnamed protein product [Gongylonema pulchrum]|uniref:Col_cuticle_N domain-containing protein n=1 Tax=Gongylonema pulchrum TaxID=637853 RepID=A0A183DI42_9BILA|nr:unnamed protein product [Gongylonema pulchrum]